MSTMIAMATMAPKLVQEQMSDINPYAATTFFGLLMFFGILTIHSKISDSILPGIARLKGFPIVGVAPLILKEGVMTFTQRLANLGNDGVAYTVIGGKTLVSVHDPELAKEMFSYSDEVASKLGDVRYFGWSPFWTLIRMIGYNQYDDVGPVAAKRRTYILKEFQSTKANSGKFEGIRQLADQHVRTIAGDGTIGKTMDVRLTMDQYSAAVFGEALYGRDDAKTDNRIIKIADEILGRMASSWSAVRYMFLLVLGRVKHGEPTPGEARVRRELEDLYEINYAHLEDYERKNPGAPRKAMRVLSMMDGGASSGPLTKFAEEFSRLSIFGGHHSVGSNSSWLLIELGKHPEHLAKLLAEIDQVDENDFTSVDTKTPFLDACLLEINRLYPFVPATLRVMERETVLQGAKKRVVLKPGMMIYIPYLHIHTSPKYWGPNAADFDPRRFENGIQKDQPYLAFGVGIRHCVGYKFALLAAKVYMIKLLKTYDFNILDKDCKALLNNLLESSVKVRVEFTRRQKTA